MSTATASSWSPRISGASAAQALAAVEAIARDLAAGSTPLPPGLNRGEAGRALFFAYLGKALKHAEAGEQTRIHLESAVARLAEQPSPAAGLYHGYAGVAWAVEHITAGWPSDPSEDGEEDPNEEIDEALLSLLRESPWRGGFDLVGGLAGWGVYALERLPRPGAAAMLPLVVSRLAERPLWPDPGMAHGAAGVIAFLARLLEGAALETLDTEARRDASALLAAAVDGVLSSPPQAGAGEHGDLAWCSGGAGLSAALLAAGRSLGRTDWTLEARRLALSAAAREPDRDFDPALCHGTLGLSHLFYRLYQATDEEELLAASHRWLGLTLAQRRPGEGIGGWLVDSSFLGGAAGIGLGLLAAATPVEPAWDRLLLLG